MSGNKNVIEMLDEWGEWERCGSAYLAHLQTKSPMGVWIDSVLPAQRAFAPSMNDEDALAFGKIMLELKKTRPAQYKILFLVHVWKLSMRDVAICLDISRGLADKEYARAVERVECYIEFKKAA